MSDNNNRNLILCGEISDESVSPLIKSIREINAIDSTEEDKLSKYTRKPIELIINTPGGSVDSGLALIGAIEMSKTPIHTITLGSAASMGLYVLVSGHKRYAHRFATLMFHDMSAWQYGTLEQTRRRMDEWTRVRDMNDEYLISRTKVTQKMLDPYIERVEEWYIDAQTALKLNIIDEVM